MARPSRKGHKDANCLAYAFDFNEWWEIDGYCDKEVSIPQLKYEVLKAINSLLEEANDKQRIRRHMSDGFDEALVVTLKLNSRGFHIEKWYPFDGVYHGKYGVLEPYTSATPYSPPGDHITFMYEIIDKDRDKPDESFLEEYGDV